MNNSIIPIHKYFSRQECLKGREVYYPLTEEMERNLIKLLNALNPLREAYGKPLQISSLYRTPAGNAEAGGAKKSNHLLCLACDFKDTDGKFGEWCEANLDLLEKHGLYMEARSHTPGWTHLQAKAPNSGNRIFLP